MQICIFKNLFAFSLFAEIVKITTPIVERKQICIFNICFGFYVMSNKKKLETEFKRNLVEELETMFPGALIYKNESKQGLPDLTVLYRDRWALLECKREAKSSHRMNQDYYIERANQMSFARFIYPENKQEVLDELQQAFGTGG